LVGVRVFTARFSFIRSISIFLFFCYHFPMGQIQYVSAERLEQLKVELQDLKTVKRREAAARIEVAKALGDLAENAEYHEAKEAMALAEGRIFELEEILKNVALIEEQKSTKGVVGIGSSVEVEARGQRKTFMIVGSNEADPQRGKVSNESPIGSALLGSRVGDEVDVQTPAGVIVYEVIAIS
jgi:transcription elongation factor GreA